MPAYRYFFKAHMRKFHFPRMGGILWSAGTRFTNENIEVRVYICVCLNVCMCVTFSTLLL